LKNYWDESETEEVRNGPKVFLTKLIHDDIKHVGSDVSLPELNNGKRHWFEILYGDSAWKTGGHHVTLPSPGPSTNVVNP
jgi:hypothetical protein